VVCLSVTLVSPEKTAGLIEMLFGMLSWMDPRNHILDGVQIRPWEGAFFEEGHAPACPMTLCHQL